MWSVFRSNSYNEKGRDSLLNPLAGDRQTTLLYRTWSLYVSRRFLKSCYCFPIRRNMFPLQVILCLLPTIFFVFVDDFLCVFFFFFLYGLFRSCRCLFCSASILLCISFSVTMAYCFILKRKKNKIQYKNYDSLVCTLFGPRVCPIHAYHWCTPVHL